MAAITTAIRANIYWDSLWAGCGQMPLSESCPRGCEAVRLALCYTHLTQEESEALEPCPRAGRASIGTQASLATPPAPVSATLGQSPGQPPMAPLSTVTSLCMSSTSHRGSIFTHVAVI